MRELGDERSVAEEMDHGTQTGQGRQRSQEAELML